MKMNGEILTVISWLRQSGYTVSLVEKEIQRQSGCKRKDYLESRARAYGFKVVTAPNARDIERQHYMDENNDKARLAALDLDRQKRHREEEHRRMVAKAWERVKQADPNKVVCKLLNTVPLTEREQRLIEYYSLAFQGTEKGGGIIF